MNRLAALVTLASLALAAPAVARNSFKEVDLVSDLPGRAAQLDANLVNPWGIVVGGQGGLRVADNGMGVSTIYSAAGLARTPTITIPPAGSGTPSGVVVNRSTTAFVVTNGGKTGPSRLLFASEDGTISAWSPAVDTANAFVVVTTPDAVYKGLTIAHRDEQTYLLAANFHAGTVDVFDAHFAPVTWAGAFVDPTLPAGFAPFNIASLNGRLYVAYALQKPDKHDDQSGPGNGYVDVFTQGGQFVNRLVSAGPLNSPWALVLAPEEFGPFGHALLVGNFGDGLIHAFNPETGLALGALEDSAGAAITIPNLWGLAFGASFDRESNNVEEDSGDTHDSGDGDSQGGDSAVLYFAAGIEDEAHGLLGALHLARQGDDDGEDADNEHADDSGDNDLRVAVLGARPARISDGDGVRFRITVATPAPVRLQVFDASGRAVAEPLRDGMPAGESVVAWNGRNFKGARVPGGAYFYRAISGNHIAKGRLLLLR